MHFLPSQLKAFAQKNLYACFGETLNYTRTFVSLQTPPLFAHSLYVEGATLKAECHTLTTRDSLTGLMAFAFVYFNPHLLKDGWTFWGIDRLNIPNTLKPTSTLTLQDISFTNDMIQAHIPDLGIIRLYYRPSFPFPSTKHPETLDRDAMLHAALGFPSMGSLDTITEFDDTLKLIPRLPNHELLCVSAIENVGESSCESIYYHPNNLPFVLFLEAALQPCGWLAFYHKSYRHLEGNTHIRNLEGTLTFHQRPVFNKTLRFKVQKTSEIPLKAASTVMMKFKIEGYIHETHICTITSTFGYFEPKALEKAAKVPMPKITHPQNHMHPIKSHAFSVVDRIVYKSDAVIHGKRAISPDDFYFKAHFLQDPVQPGSLGLQAFFDLLEKDYTTLKGLSWKYRGQVTPHHHETEFIVLKQTECDEGFLVVDGDPIYSAKMYFSSPEDGK